MATQAQAASSRTERQDIYLIVFGAFCALFILRHALQVVCHKRLKSPGEPVAAVFRCLQVSVLDRPLAFGLTIQRMAFLLCVLALNVVFAVINDVTPGNQTSTLRNIAKAFGRACFVNLPIIYMLAGRNNLLGLLTGLSYQSLRWSHYALSFMVVIFALLHSIIYSFVFLRGGQAAYRSTMAEPFVIWGAIAITAFTVMSAVAVIRHYAYEVHLIVHVISAALIIPALLLHLPDLAPFVWAALAVWMFDRTIRLLRVLLIHAILPFWKHGKLGFVEAKVTPSNDAVLVSIPTAVGWQPGSHVYLQFWTQHNIKRVWLLPQWHPFSIANAEEHLVEGQRSMLFVIKIHDHATKRLWQSAIEADKGSLRVPVLIEGPYAPNLDAPCQTLVLCAAGSGITHIMPYLTEALTSGPRKIIFHWTLRNVEHVAWVADQLLPIMRRLKEEGKETLRLQLNLTDSLRRSSFDETSSTGCLNRTLTSGTLPINSGSAVEEILLAFDVREGRPDYVAMLQDALDSTSDRARLSVQVCGPSKMMRQVRVAAAQVSDMKKVMKVKSIAAAGRRLPQADLRLSKMRVEQCAFSGYKIYPGTGKLYVRIDSKVFRFKDSKSESLFLQRKNPRKIAWTVVFRRAHKKGITEEVAKKRSRKTVKHQRGIVGADLTSILAKRNQKPEVRDAARQAAIKASKDAKKAQAEKKQAAKVCRHSCAVKQGG
ncbi:uncharacterized protein L969DRAFT_43130 [Mixia osmundae IAM 14324]|uniref:FAD-binding FR-type domain-containing protein n=1 Tax=Mixia osmundae (strain CBS 9802 / IAM 14324 / JCM 22182 / KY 12970) TaxID=764103 RepID=G7E074_MIXOS|nr:uncharacterized protein L969DRAFT_43130 [Mixia osmundae IAM 14324]KEI42224.1 hypothetical protein L969DRAFT_43130 [Mixia osmundae IAM 14324]GAA96234.1 hypothetical protein E5Q_02898 [Mixia osmundae IAM 14324]